MRLGATFVTLLFGFISSALWAGEKPAEAPKPDHETPAISLGEPASTSDDDASANLSITTHKVKIAGETIAYTATAGTLALTGEDEEKKADAFFIAYTVPTKNSKPRPITFCFNGGPGSSSVWLHLGMLGPRKVALPNEPKDVAPPAQVIDNHQSLLDVTDLVFIDPVSTGYSRPAEGEKKEQFHGYKEDLKSVGRFIHLYTTKYRRWGSRKYLCGESYGTLRAAGLADHLSDRYNLELNGIILISAVLDFQTISFDATNDLPYVLFLPSYATTAWYHDQLSEGLQAKSVRQVAKLAREFAFGDYATALLKGDSLNKEERQDVIARYAELTGLSRRYVARADLRLSMGRFAMQLLRKRGLGLGRFDSRFIGPQHDQTGARVEYDPSAAALFGPFTSALYQVMWKELGIDKTIPYEILTSKVHPWNYDDFTNEYVQSAASLADIMARNRHLKVFVAAGYYDLATPFAAAEYTFDHLDIGQGRDRVTFAYYPSGHMIYVHQPSLKQLREDLLKFLGAASKE